MKKNISLCLVLIAWMFVLYIGKSLSQTNLTYESKDDTYRTLINYEQGYIEVSAIGTPDPHKSQTMAEKKVWACFEATQLANMKIAELIRAIRLTSETTIKNETMVDQRFAVQIDEIVKGAHIIEESTETMPDGTPVCKVRMGMIITGNRSLNKQLIQKMRERIRPGSSLHPSGVQANLPESFDTSMKYTGLVIDLRGFQVQPVMYPRILAQDERMVYNPTEVDEEYASSMGVVGYARNMDSDEVKQRIGSNPLVIKAKNVSGTFKGDAVVTDEAAAQILWADQKGDFLPECRVVFLVD